MLWMRQGPEVHVQQEEAGYASQGGCEATLRGTSLAELWASASPS